MRAICEFIGVTYDASMENFSSVVRDDAIRSPSALQVKRELYREGVAQWRPYAAQLDIVAPLWTAGSTASAIRPSKGVKR
jgi:hypothetical protein